MPFPSSKTSRKSFSGRRSPQQSATSVHGSNSRAGLRKIDAQALPPPPSSAIPYVDGYGNIKTTIAYKEKKVTSGTCTRVEINDCEHEARVSDGDLPLAMAK